MDWASVFLSDLADRVSGLKGEARRAYDDLSYFSRYCMAYNNEEYAENSQFIDDIFHTLQYEPDNNVLIIGPRNSAKSTAVTVTYAAWMIGRNPLIRICVACAVQELQGEAFVRQLQTIIEKNPRYIEIFGELKPKDPQRWTQSEFIVQRPEPPSGLKDATVITVGVGSAVPSKRADILIIDDVVTLRNSATEAQREGVKNFVIKSLRPILTPGGKRIVIGTRWHEDDLYAYFSRAWGLPFPEPEPINLYEVFLPWLQQPDDSSDESLLEAPAHAV